MAELGTPGQKPSIFDTVRQKRQAVESAENYDDDWTDYVSADAAILPTLTTLTTNYSVGCNYIDSIDRDEKLVDNVGKVVKIDIAEEPSPIEPAAQIETEPAAAEIVESDETTLGEEWHVPRRRIEGEERQTLIKLYRQHYPTHSVSYVPLDDATDYVILEDAQGMHDVLPTNFGDPALFCSHAI
jgi:hypothetical protein